MNNISLHREWFPTGSIGFARGVSGSLHISSFARFYCLPMLSWTDVAFPAWLRFFTTTNDFSKNSTDALWSPWAFDGTHLSQRGQGLLATKEGTCALFDRPSQTEGSGNLKSFQRKPLLRLRFAHVFAKSS